MRSQTFESESLDPILLVEGSAQPEWLWEWIWQAGDDRFPCPKDLLVQRRDTETSENYERHLNNIAVYYAPIPQGAVLLMSKQLFKKISFTRQENGLPVTLRTEFDPNELNVTLNFCWKQKIELGPTPIIRLEY